MLADILRGGERSVEVIAPRVLLEMLDQPAVLVGDQDHVAGFVVVVKPAAVGSVEGVAGSQIEARQRAPQGRGLVDVRPLGDPRRCRSTPPLGTDSSLPNGNGSSCRPPLPVRATGRRPTRRNSVNVIISLHIKFTLNNKAFMVDGLMKPHHFLPIIIFVKKGIIY